VDPGDLDFHFFITRLRSLTFSTPRPACPRSTLRQPCRRPPPWPWGTVLRSRRRRLPVPTTTTTRAASRAV